MEVKVLNKQANGEFWTSTIYHNVAQVEIRMDTVRLMGENNVTVEIPNNGQIQVNESGILYE